MKGRKKEGTVETSSHLGTESKTDGDKAGGAHRGFSAVKEDYERSGGERIPPTDCDGGNPAKVLNKDPEPENGGEKGNELVDIGSAPEEKGKRLLNPAGCGGGGGGGCG